MADGSSKEQLVIPDQSSPPHSSSLGDSEQSRIPSLSGFLPETDMDLCESSPGWWELHSQKEPDLFQKLISWRLFLQNKRLQQEGKEGIQVYGANLTQTQPISGARKGTLFSQFVRRTNMSGKQTWLPRDH